uniref:Transcription factor MYC/MYB N-terminal domain-containing protein n=1 Tax=Kalanchoe fedtschenkoi TaxID=63787 RepID=A0A7N0TQR4_KALFE
MNLPKPSDLSVSYSAHCLGERDQHSEKERLSAQRVIVDVIFVVRIREATNKRLYNSVRVCGSGSLRRSPFSEKSMETGGLPMLNCLLQHTLRSFCSCSPDSAESSAKWVYAVFWRILPRNFPPPKWEYGGCMLDRSKGNKRNWILVWEDGYCDFYECGRAARGHVNGRFGADVFFKMSHEVYNYGEGLVGKVAAENGHKWVFRDSQSENEASIMATWNVSLDLQPRAWEAQFNSGIQTIAVISVREGIIQLGSLDKVVEDRNLVASIQRKFSYLQGLPGIFALQRPYIPIQHLQPDSHTTRQQSIVKQSHGAKRTYDQLPNAQQPPCKTFHLGWNNTQNGRRLPPVLPIPPLYPYPELHDPRDISSYVKISKFKMARVTGSGLELCPAQELKPTSSGEPKTALNKNPGSNDAAGPELEFRMAKNDEESKTLDLI